jgi:predicted RNA polymerase sigma factor
LAIVSSHSGKGNHGNRNYLGHNVFTDNTLGLLHKLGRYEEARLAFEAAAALADNSRERDLLRRRAAEAADAAMSS